MRSRTSRAMEDIAASVAAKRSELDLHRGFFWDGWYEFDVRIARGRLGGLGATHACHLVWPAQGVIEWQVWGR
jgi:hypothetical protein